MSSSSSFPGSSFPGFEKIAPGSYLRQSEGDAPDDQPAAIVLFGWMNGAPAHIRKYTDAYAQIYPSSSLLLVQSATGIFTSGKAENERQLQPVADWLKKSGLLKQKDSRLLIHTMSNGGAIRANDVARLLKKANATAPAKPSRDGPPRAPIEAAFPARAYILDSTPGKPRLSGFINAFTAHLAKRPWWHKIPYLAVIIPVHFVILLYSIITRRPDAITLLWRRLLDPSLYNQQAPRAYLYGNGDKTIDARDVEEHIAEAKQMGGKVEAVLFKRSPHVSHMRSDPDRYWKAIQDIYKSGS